MFLSLLQSLILKVRSHREFAYTFAKLLKMGSSVSVGMVHTTPKSELPAVIRILRLRILARFHKHTLLRILDVNTP